MSAVALPLARPAQPGSVLLPILAIALGIGAVGPFDHLVQLLTHGSLLARMVLISVLAGTGGVIAIRGGLSLKGITPHWALVAFASAIAVALYVCFIDAFLFRRVLPPDYLLVFQTKSLNIRLTYYFMRAFQENVLYRLFVFSVLIYGVSRLRGQDVRALPSALVCTISVATQILNVAINNPIAEHASAMLLTYDFLRYVMPGALWGWLYWRYGFTTIEAGHVGCHLFLQPALGIFLHGL